MTEVGGAKHETRDINYKKVVLSGVIFFAVGFGSLFVSRPLFDLLSSLTHQPDLPTTPEVEVRAPDIIDPRTEMGAASGDEIRELRRKETDKLSSFGYIDRARNIVHVPIERAMEVIASRGLPARPSPTSTTAPSEPSIANGESNGFSEGGMP